MAERYDLPLSTNHPRILINELWKLLGCVCINIVKIWRSEKFHYVTRTSRTSPRLTIPTLRGHSHLASTSRDHSHLVWPSHLVGHSHLAWPFPPYVTIPTSHPSHMTISPRVHLVWSSHLMWPFPPPVPNLAWPLPPHVGILTSCDHSHLAWPSHLVGHSHLLSISRDHSHLSMQDNFGLAFSDTSDLPLIYHLAYTLRASPHAKIISFTSHGKIPKKVMKQPRFHR